MVINWSGSVTILGTCQKLAGGRGWNQGEGHEYFNLLLGEGHHISVTPFTISTPYPLLISDKSLNKYDHMQV